jgi:hypothetical protein
MNQKPILKYGMITQGLLSNGSAIIPPDCNGFTVMNLGLTVAMINYSIPLNPGTPGTNNGESFSIGGNRGEIFAGRIDISFPLNSNGSIMIIYKIYV